MRGETLLPQSRFELLLAGELRESADDGAAGEHRVRTAVRDEGEGIEPSFLPYAKRAGLGLGLAIVRHIIGDIQAESEGLGKGATFVVTLPAQASLPQQQPPSQPKTTNVIA